MANEKLMDRWAAYRPSKAAWFWSVAGAAVATMLVGFTFGGWTTSGTANAMAAEAARDARAQLASTVCVEKFAAAEDSSVRLEELKSKTSYQQDNFIEDGGWAMMLGMDKVVPGAAALCAEELAAMDALPVRSVDLKAEPVETSGG